MKKLMLLVAVLSLVVLAGGQMTTSAQEAEVAWVCPEGFEGQVLRLFNWTTYIADETIPRFEELCGVTVEYFEFGSNEEMLNVIRSESAQFDVSVPSGNTVAIMIAENLVLPLNYDLIPNAANVLPALKGQSYDPENAYSLPYQWGTIGIGYDTNYVDEPIETWEDFFAYEGRVAWLDDARAILGVGLFLNGSDPNSTDQEEIMAAAQHMLDISQGDVFQIAPDTGQDLLLRGEVDAVMEYSGDILQLAADCGCEDYQFVIPPQGVNIWTDNMVIPFNAPNPELAHAFLDYILDAAVGAELSNYTAYASPNAASLELLPEEIRTNEDIYPSAEVLEAGFVASYVGDAEVFYSEAWSLINAELGGN